MFNFEGGCYAKMIRLSAEAEPQIYATTRRFGTVLENVVIDPATRALNFDDASLTENTRAAYPIEFIDNAVPSGTGGHPQNIVMLTADAYGVLPPIARLSAEGAMYHYLSGYTAKVAGTEKGVTEPSATFSTCFGAPFLPLNPNVYAKQLGERIAKYQSRVWLVNTGWTGGPHGVGTPHEDRLHARDDPRRAVGRARPASSISGTRCSTSTCRRRVPACPTRCSIRAARGPTRRRTISRPPSWRACSSRTSRPTSPTRIRTSPPRPEI